MFPAGRARLARMRHHVRGQKIIRTTDFLAASALLIFLSPLMVLLASITVWTGPVVYRQKRLGQRGRIFYCYKFRTLVRAVEGGDPQLTKMGKFMRRSSLDELPQLFNVVLGEMSLVGPRPRSRKAAVHVANTIEWLPGEKPGLLPLPEDESVAHTGRSKGPVRRYLRAVLLAARTLFFER